MAESDPSFQAETPDISISALIDAVLDHKNPIPPKYLYRFSDLAGDELIQFQNIWPQIALPRRIGLIEDLEILSESNYLVSFDSVFIIGLSDEDAEIRQIALRSLWECDDPSLIPQLLDLLKNDPAIQVQAQAASGLGHFILLGEIGRIQKRFLKKINESLIAFFDEESPALIRQSALESLGYSSHPKIPGIIEDAYDSGDEDWLASSLVAMGRSEDEQWHPFIVDNLDHNNVKVRLMATQAAGKLSIPDALPTLMYLLNDEDDEVQMAAIWSLSEIGGEDVREVLDNLLEGTEDEELIEIIDNAIENLIFNENLKDFSIMDFPHNDQEDFENQQEDEE